jgi:hypothetical protein
MDAKRILRWAAVTLLALLPAVPAAQASDPVMSLHSLHTDQEAVAEPAMEGVWVYAGESLQLKVKKNPGEINSYSLQLCGKTENESLWFEVHLVRLGSTLFADIRQSSELGLFELHPHVFATVQVNGDELRFDFLSENFVHEQLNAGRADLAHEDVDGTLVLTAPTRALQAFVQSCAFVDEAFDEHVSFTRLQAAPDDSNL